MSGWGCPCKRSAAATWWKRDRAGGVRPLTCPLAPPTGEVAPPAFLFRPLTPFPRANVRPRGNIWVGWGRVGWRVGERRSETDLGPLESNRTLLNVTWACHLLSFVTPPYLVLVG